MSDKDRLINHSDATRIASLLEDIGEHYNQSVVVPTSNSNLSTSIDKDRLINHEDGLNIISSLKMIKNSYGISYPKPYLIDSTIPYEEGVTANILDHLIGFDPSKMLIYGDITASEQSKNTCYITFKSMNDRWLDGSGEKFEIKWNYGNPFDPSIFDNTSFTQAQIVEILNGVNDAGISLSDYRNKLVGKIVTLNNSADTRTYLPGQYIIADINHQDMYQYSTSYTLNTIDLIATNSVIANRTFSNTSPLGQWSTSDIRTWLNGDFKNGFDTEIKALMSQMIVESYYGTGNQVGGITDAANNNTTDYVKLLSYTELNCSTFHQFMSAREGTPYSDIFTSGTYNSSNTSRVKGSNTSSSGNQWWTRSINSADTADAYYVKTEGNMGGDHGYYSYGVVPVLRLKAV